MGDFFRIRSGGFTLIELLVVIAIIAVIATATILVINPAELIKQGRDSTRLSDLNNINRSLGFLQVDSPSSSFGTSSIVYISIPDTSSTCANLGLASLPDGWAYSCATDANHRNTDGTGWIPADFTSFSAGSPLSVLPIDPINTTSTGNYYTYVTGGSWEVAAGMESTKRQGITNTAGEDGGTSFNTYETGNNLSLTPLQVEEYKRDSSLVGYWTFDEGSGTTANDSSGNSNTGTLANNPTWQSTANCKTEICLSFDGTDDYVDVGNALTEISRNKNFSVSLWFKTYDAVTLQTLLENSQAGDDRLGISVYNSAVRVGVYNGTSYNSKSRSIIANEWYYLAIVHSSGTLTGYLNNIIMSGSATPSTHGGDRLSIGIRAGLINSPLNGIIDDLRIYNRALSVAEIQAIYNATK